MGYYYMISILIPIYNGIEFLFESLESVIQQTYTDWELLIAVNGHPKNSSVFQQARYATKCYPQHRIVVLDFHDIKGKSTTLNRMLR
jgi:glycosyltransferase involved in cell wall biosynthesis